MITETLLNSLKSLFSSLGAKTSDNNYAVGLFDKTNGEPKGMMGMSDLASVLGGVVNMEFNELIDFNGWTTPGRYYLYDTAITRSSNKPPVSAGGILDVKQVGPLLYQKYYENTGASICTRTLTSNTWGVWCKYDKTS